MFGFISKKKLVENITEIYLEEDTSKAWSENNLYYRMGNANALNGLCNRLGIDLTNIIRSIKAGEASEEEE